MQHGSLVLGGQGKRCLMVGEPILGVRISGAIHSLHSWVHWGLHASPIWEGHKHCLREDTVTQHPQTLLCTMLRATAPILLTGSADASNRENITSQKRSENMFPSGRDVPPAHIAFETMVDQPLRLPIAIEHQKKLACGIGHHIRWRFAPSPPPMVQATFDMSLAAQ